MGGPSGGAPQGQNQFSGIGSMGGVPQQQGGGLGAIMNNPQFQQMLMGALGGRGGTADRAPEAGRRNPNAVTQLPPRVQSQPAQQRSAPPTAQPVARPPVQAVAQTPPIAFNPGYSGGFASPGVGYMGPQPSVLNNPNVIPPAMLKPRPLLPTGPGNYKPAPPVTPQPSQPTMPSVNFNQLLKLREMEQNPDQTPLIERLRLRRRIEGKY